MAAPNRVGCPAGSQLTGRMPTPEKISTYAKLINKFCKLCRLN